MVGFDGGSVSFSNLSIPVARPRPSFLAAAAIAQVLDPTNRRLTELLDSGSASNLSEAIHQLNPSEQNQLRERWGRSLDELISLSSERDATIFQHGLLELGHRLEDADQLELASVLYSALVAGNAPRPPLTLRGGEVGGVINEGENHVPPLRVRGGQEELLPVLARAQARLNAIHGVGDWRARLAFNLERLPTNATRWDMLLAMSGAGLVFRGVRLAATARWASSFESAFALNAAATSTAFLSETAAFTGLGRLFGTMAGNHYDWSAEGTFNEWAGGAAMLLGLKAMGGVFGNLSEGWAAGETAFARMTRAVAPQAGMFSGIVLGNRLAELGGFHPERHGDSWLVDGLTTLLEFNIAGRLQRSAGGPGLTNLEGRMETYTRALGRGEGRRWGEVFSAAMVTPEGIRMPAPESPMDHIVFSTRIEEEIGSPVPKGYGDLERLSELTPRPEATPINEGEESPAEAPERYRLPDTPYFRTLQEKGTLSLEQLAMYAESERWNAEVGPTIQHTLRFPIIGKYMYSPGGAAVVERGRERPDLLPQLMGRWRKALVASPSRAILGLGAAAEDADFSIRAEQGIPIMRGKSMYFFATAGVSADYQTWRTYFTPEQVAELRRLKPLERAARAGELRSQAFAQYLMGVANNYGFINIEDEAGEFLPGIFAMLEGLRGQCCVWSDDMMGTGVITAAGMLSWAHQTGRLGPNLSLEGIRGIIFGAGAGSKGVYDELVKHGVRPENIVVTDSRGVLFEGRRDIQENSLKREMSQGIRDGLSVEEFARGADFIVNLGSEETLTKNPVWTANLIGSLARNPIILPMTNPEPGLSPVQILALRPDAYSGSGNQEYFNPFNNFVAFGPTALGALTAQAMWMGPQMTVAAARGIFEVAQFGPPPEIRDRLPPEQREFGPFWLVPRPDDLRLIHHEAGAVAKAAGREGLSRILGSHPSMLALRAFDDRVDERMDYIHGDLTGQLQKIRAGGPEYLRGLHPARYAPLTLTREGREEVIYHLAPHIRRNDFLYFSRALDLPAEAVSEWIEPKTNKLLPTALTIALTRLRPAAESPGVGGELAHRELKLITQIAAISPALGLGLSMKRAVLGDAVPSIFHDAPTLKVTLDHIPEAETAIRVAFADLPAHN